MNIALLIGHHSSRILFGKIIIIRIIIIMIIIAITDLNSRNIEDLKIIVHCCHMYSNIR